MKQTYPTINPQSSGLAKKRNKLFKPPQIKQLVIFCLNILFNIHPVYPHTLNLLNSPLNERVTLDGNGEGEVVSLPLPGATVFQVLGI